MIIGKIKHIKRIAQKPEIEFDFYKIKSLNINMKYTVTQIIDGKVQYTTTGAEEKMQERFEAIIRDYGIEATDSNYDSGGEGLFESENGDVVQLLACDYNDN